MPLLRMMGFEETVFLSLPMPYGGKHRDAAFIGLPPGEGEASAKRPIGWVTWCARTGRPLTVNWCEQLDFVETEAYPLENPISAATLFDQPAAWEEQSYQELLASYSLFRPKVFEEPMEEAEQEILAAYREDFYRLVPAGYIPFYRELSPRFFEWSGLEAHMPSPLGQAFPAPSYKRLEELTQTLAQIVRTDTKRQSMLDSLHRELQEYRGGLLDRLTRPLELDVIGIIDGLEKSMALFKEWEPTAENYNKVLNALGGVGEDLTDLLYRAGIEPFEVPGGQVDMARQKLVELVETADPALDKTVARRVAPGYEKQEKIIRPERVSVFVYK
ncbi:nucleotide exchange factor GrpE [Oscillospiraceae bacterium MB08-C2-2]|nr:nucleotide exchange factor GrpE [Oscillospiraceae bacterium MB08-C2-2]